MVNGMFKKIDGKEYMIEAIVGEALKWVQNNTDQVGYMLKRAYDSASSSFQNRSRSKKEVMCPHLMRKLFCILMLPLAVVVDLVYLLIIVYSWFDDYAFGGDSFFGVTKRLCSVISGKNQKIFGRPHNASTISVVCDRKALVSQVAPRYVSWIVWPVVIVLVCAAVYIMLKEVNS